MTFEDEYIGRVVGGRSFCGSGGASGARSTRKVSVAYQRGAQGARDCFDTAPAGHNVVGEVRRTADGPRRAGRALRQRRHHPR